MSYLVSRKQHCILSSASHTSEYSENQFFNNHDVLKIYHNSSQSDEENKKCPGKKYFESINLFIKNHLDVGEKYLEYLKSVCDNSMCCCKAFVGLAHNTLKFQNHIQIMMLQDFTKSMFLRHQTIKVMPKELLMIISLESS